KYTAENIHKNLSTELAPVKDYYLNDHDGAARRMIVILSIAAVFILLMAVINFVNINIGTSSYRLKEIGLRKVFGGDRKQLIVQFIAEAMVLTLMAAILSLIAYQLLRPVFSQVLNTSLESLFEFSTSAILYLLVLVFATGFIAGIYPAFVLSSSQVITAIKGKPETVRGGLTLRKTMLTVQFTLAIIVFVCALTVSGQVNYIFTKDVGYDKEQILVITVFPKQWDSIGTNKMIDIRNNLMQLPFVKNASLSFEIPDRKPPGSFEMEPVNKVGRKVLITSGGVDENYAGTFAIKLLRGSCFDQNGVFIPNQIVLNESAVKALGLTMETAVNTQLRTGTATGSPSSLTVAGVIKDFNYSSLLEPIGPLAFFNVRDAQAYRYLSLKLNTINITETVTRIQNKWKELSPGAPFEYSFMDEKFQSLYRSELQLKKATTIATMFNLIIVFLGIFGVVAFTLVKRTKEIAVRKVLGANVKNIILLFVRDYTWVMLLANGIAWPLTYLITNKWLEQYAYRIKPDISVYLIVCFSVFAASLLIIAVQSLKAGLANPVKSLRSE
ncbi:MAG: FtsX-like permease family protein, partial [Flavisolibacter sp.]